MITLEHVYWLSGAVLAAYAILSAHDASNRKRFGNAAFWALLAASFAGGSYLGDFGNGLIALALVAVGGFGLMHRGAGATTTPEERQASAARRGNWLFAPVLVMPAVAIAGTFLLKSSGLADPKQATLVFVALGAVVAVAVCYAWLRPPVLAPLQEGRRLLDTVGWTAVLPQMLAALGAVFALSGTGEAIGDLAAHYLPLGNPYAAVAAYCIGMAVFTALMGNAFAAFPVLTAGIGLPLIVHRFGGNPAAMSAIGMLCGFCGTLMTPMAANFNLVPARLLELPDPNGVIKAQLPTALMLLGANTVLMMVLVYRA